MSDLLTRLLDDDPLRARLGDNARNHAVRTFDIGRIADRFEGLWSNGHSAAPPAAAAA